MTEESLAKGLTGSKEKNKTRIFDNTGEWGNRRSAGFDSERRAGQVGGDDCERFFLPPLSSFHRN